MDWETHDSDSSPNQSDNVANNKVLFRKSSWGYPEMTQIKQGTLQEITPSKWKHIAQIQQTKAN